MVLDVVCIAPFTATISATIFMDPREYHDEARGSVVEI